MFSNPPTLSMPAALESSLKEFHPIGRPRSPLQRETRKLVLDKDDIPIVRNHSFLSRADLYGAVTTTRRLAFFAMNGAGTEEKPAGWLLKSEVEWKQERQREWPLYRELVRLHLAGNRSLEKRGLFTGVGVKDNETARAVLAAACLHTGVITNPHKRKSMHVHDVLEKTDEILDDSNILKALLLQRHHFDPLGIEIGIRTFRKVAEPTVITPEEANLSIPNLYPRLRVGLAFLAARDGFRLFRRNHSSYHEGAELRLDQPTLIQWLEHFFRKRVTVDRERPRCLKEALIAMRETLDRLGVHIKVHVFQLDDGKIPPSLADVSLPLPEVQGGAVTLQEVMRTDGFTLLKEGGEEDDEQIVNKEALRQWLTMTFRESEAAVASLSGATKRSQALHDGEHEHDEEKGRVQQFKDFYREVNAFARSLPSYPSAEKWRQMEDELRQPSVGPAVINRILIQLQRPILQLIIRRHQQAHDFNYANVMEIFQASLIALAESFEDFHSHALKVHVYKQVLWIAIRFYRKHGFIDSMDSKRTRRIVMDHPQQVRQALAQSSPDDQRITITWLNIGSGKEHTETLARELAEEALGILDTEIISLNDPDTGVALPEEPDNEDTIKLILLERLRVLLLALFPEGSRQRVILEDHWLRDKDDTGYLNATQIGEHFGRTRERAGQLGTRFNPAYSFWRRIIHAIRTNFTSREISLMTGNRDQVSEDLIDFALQSTLSEER